MPDKLRLIEWNGANDDLLERVYHTHHWIRRGELLECDTCIMSMSIAEGIDRLNGHEDDWGDNVFHLLSEDE